MVKYWGCDDSNTLKSKDKITMASTNKISMEFGFYPLSLDLTDTRFSITSYPDRAQRVRNVRNDSAVINGWFYASLIDRRDENGEIVGPPGRIFGLPKTHTISITDVANEEEVKFVIWCLSFFLGLRLTTEECGFIDATPIEKMKLNDFFSDEPSIKAGVNLAIQFVDKHTGDARSLKRIEAIIHALFMAHNPQALCFERFQYLYMALDACYRQVFGPRIKSSSDIPHNQRIEWLCNKFNIVVPPWATNQGGTMGSLSSTTRNDSIHEALFFDEPLGFSVFGGNTQPDDDGIILQMGNIICRLLVAILGKPDAKYVTTPYADRQYTSLDLI